MVLAFFSSVPICITCQLINISFFDQGGVLGVVLFEVGVQAVK